MQKKNLAHHHQERAEDGVSIISTSMNSKDIEVEAFQKQ
jgi:hypothetical protein